MTTIGIIGSGHVGSSLAKAAVANGYDVVLSNSQGPDSLTGLVRDLGPHARAATPAEALARWTRVNAATSSAVGSVTNAPVSAFNPKPQWARTSATTESRTSVGARSLPLAHIPYSTSASTRSGYRAAIAAAT